MAIEAAETTAPSNPGGKRNDPFADFPRDQHKRPKIIRAVFCEETGEWLVPKDGDGKPIKELVPFTRASTLGGAIEYQGGLHRWKAAVVAWAIARHRTLAKRARAIAGYSRRDDKDELYEIIDQADTWAESNSKANHGTALHSLFRRIAEGATVEDLIADGTLNPAEPDDVADIAACQAFADAITRWTVVWAERRVVCDEAQAAGKYDLIVTPKRPMPVTDKDGNVVDVIMPGDLVVVDNKTSGSADFFGEKFTVQLWIYANGRDYDKETGARTEVGVRKDWALILHIPSDEETVVATWHWVDLTAGEKLVKIARDVMEGRKIGKRSITVADLDAEIPAELLERVERERAGVRPDGTYGPDADGHDPAETTDERFAREEAARRVRKAEVDAELTGAEKLAEDPATGVPPTEHVITDVAHDPATGTTELRTESLAQRLQRSAKEAAAVPDAERARAYLVRKLKAATSEREVVDLWRRASRKGYWPKDDAELNALGAEARQRIAGAESVPVG